MAAPAPRPSALEPAAIHRFVEELIGDDAHAERVLSHFVIRFRACVTVTTAGAATRSAAE